jgi:hypothetical protein
MIFGLRRHEFIPEFSGKISIVEVSLSKEYFKPMIKILTFSVFFEGDITIY